MSELEDLRKELEEAKQKGNNYKEAMHKLTDKLILMRQELAEEKQDLSLRTKERDELAARVKELESTL